MTHYCQTQRLELSGENRAFWLGYTAALHDSLNQITREPATYTKWQKEFHKHTHTHTQKKGQILSAVLKPALDSIISGIIRTGESVHPCSPFSCVLGSVLVKELKKKSNDLLYELGSNGGACCISCHLLLLLLHHLSLSRPLCVPYP